MHVGGITGGGCGQRGAGCGDWPVMQPTCIGRETLVPAGSCASGWGGPVPAGGGSGPDLGPGAMAGPMAGQLVAPVEGRSVRVVPRVGGGAAGACRRPPVAPGSRGATRRGSRGPGAPRGARRCGRGRPSRRGRPGRRGSPSRRRGPPQPRPRPNAARIRPKNRKRKNSPNRNPKNANAAVPAPTGAVAVAIPVGGHGRDDRRDDGALGRGGGDGRDRRLRRPAW